MYIYIYIYLFFILKQYESGYLTLNMVQVVSVSNMNMLNWIVKMPNINHTRMHSHNALGLASSNTNVNTMSYNMSGIPLNWNILLIEDYKASHWLYGSKLNKD